MRLTEQVHLKLKEVLRPGDTAVDATAGNGHDTLAMAVLVEPSGRVVAIDLQSAAIEATKTRLKEASQLAQCTLLEGDHAEVLNNLLSDYHTTVSAITFNLGYLPGGEKAITTAIDTTLEALNAAQQLLRQGGILLVTAYRGHPGGPDEAHQIELWMRSLPEEIWHIETQEPPTRDIDRIPPILWIAQKLQKKGEARRPPLVINKLQRTN